MNIGHLIELIKSDASLLDDVPAFISKMNKKNITVVTKTRTEVADKEETISLAERNGGELTQADIDAALKIIEQEPLKQKAEDKFCEVLSAINSGEVKTLDAVDLKIKEVSGK